MFNVGKTQSNVVKSENNQEMSNIRREKLYWRKMAGLLAIMLVLCLIGFFYIFSVSKTRIPKSIVKGTLAQFVRSVRSVSSDAVVVGQNIKIGYAHTTIKGKRELEKMLKNRGVSSLLDFDINIMIEITGVEYRRKNAYYAEWKEIKFQDNKLLSSQKFKGSFYFSIMTLDDKEVFPLNSTGIYIDAFTIKKI